jgi:hypothetical protein
MVVDHRNKTIGTMEVLQIEWETQGLVKIAPYHRAIKLNQLKKKQKMLTMASADATVEKIELEKIEVEITRLESETLEEHTQRVKANATAKASDRRRRGRRRKRGIERRRRRRVRMKKRDSERRRRGRGQWRRRWGKGMCLLKTLEGNRSAPCCCCAATWDGAGRSTLEKSAETESMARGAATWEAANMSTLDEAAKIMAQQRNRYHNHNNYTPYNIVVITTFPKWRGFRGGFHWPRNYNSIT